MLSPIISHTDMIFTIFESRITMNKFSISQLEHLRDCVDSVLVYKIEEQKFIDDIDDIDD